jgi:hypothetical protein
MAATFASPTPEKQYDLITIEITSIWFAGAVVGTLDPLPAGLLPKIAPPNNRRYHDLCQPLLPLTRPVNQRAEQRYGCVQASGEEEISQSAVLIARAAWLYMACIWEIQFGLRALL